MYKPAHALAAIFVVTMLMIGSVCFIPHVRADDTSSEKVPAPQISEFHNYNISESYNGQSQGNFDNEEWGISVHNGDMITRMTARNYSNTHGIYVDYSLNFNFYLGGKFYIAMFTMDQVVLIIGNDTLTIPLKNCERFELTYSPVVYVGNNPTFYCNATFINIRAHRDAPESAFDLTLINHFTGDWSQTSIKVEALLDFTDTDLGDYDAGVPFTAEVHYIMQLTDPASKAGPPDYNTIKPSKYTDSSLEYDLTYDNGSPYSLSKLDMDESYTVNNASGTRSAVGYSRIDSPNNAGGQMQYNPNSRVVTHGFPGLIYKDTLSMKSDPEVTVYHDRLNNGSGLMFIAVIGAIVAIAAVGAVFLFRRRKKRSTE